HCPPSVPTRWPSTTAATTTAVPAPEPVAGGHLRHRVAAYPAAAVPRCRRAPLPPCPAAAVPRCRRAPLPPCRAAAAAAAVWRLLHGAVPQQVVDHAQRDRQSGQVPGVAGGDVLHRLAGAVQHRLVALHPAGEPLLRRGVGL